MYMELHGQQNIIYLEQATVVLILLTLARSTPWFYLNEEEKRNNYLCIAFVQYVAYNFQMMPRTTSPVRKSWNRLFDLKSRIMRPRKPQPCSLIRGGSPAWRLNHLRPVCSEQEGNYIKRFISTLACSCLSNCSTSRTCYVSRLGVNILGYRSPVKTQGLRTWVFFAADNPTRDCICSHVSTLRTYISS